MHNVNITPSIVFNPQSKPESRALYLIKILILAVIYYICARVGMIITIPGTDIGLIWPPVGIMLGLMLIMGYHIWPAVALGAFLSIFPYQFSHNPPFLAVIISLGQTASDVIELVLAVYLIKRFSDSLTPFTSNKNVLIFIAATIVSQAVGAFVGVFCLYLGPAADGSAFGSMWTGYWISNIESILIITPFFLIWFQDWTPLFHLTRREFLGHFVIYSLIISATLFVFRTPSPLNHTFVEYFTILFIISSAIILGRHGAAAASLIISIIAIWNTASGLGPFAQSSPQEAVSYLEIYLITLSACSIVISCLLYERQQSEIGLRKFLRAIEHSNTSIIITDANGSIDYVNPQFCNITGYSQADVIGKRPNILKSGHTPPEEYKNLWETIKAGKEWHGEFLNKRKNGEFFWEIASISPVINEKKQITHFVGIKEDITERKKNEQDLYALLRFKNEMLETAAVWIDTLDDQGNVTFWNLAAERISGYSNTEVLGHSKIWEWLYPDAVYRALISDKAFDIIQKGERVENFETTIRCKNGEKRVISWHSNNLVDEKGKTIGSFAIAADVTQRKQAEGEIRHLNAILEERVVERTRQLEQTNKELESFAYSISHDLRSPLRAINGFTRILEEEYITHLDADAKNIMDRILANTQRMGHLIDDLLTFSRNGRSPLQKQNIQPEILIQQAMQELQHEREGRQVELIIVYPLPGCEADPILIKQVFINLISNALKFTRSRKVAHIEVGYVHEAARGDGYLGYYYVRDNGVGFDMQYEDKLFGVFQRLHAANEYEGTGVGLANVQRIIQRHGGHVWAQAEIDKGATFFFTL
jgi:PAS domain S-box-containing protein